MRKLLLRWILLAISVAAASMISQALGLGFKLNLSLDHSLSHNSGQFLTLLVGVAALAFLNATVGRIIKFLTVPISCLTLGLSTLVVNALILWAAAELQLGFIITGSGFNGFLAAFVASILIAFINGILGTFLGDDDKKSDNN